MSKVNLSNAFHFNEKGKEEKTWPHDHSIPDSEPEGTLGTIMTSLLILQIKKVRQRKDKCPDLELLVTEAECESMSFCLQVQHSMQFAMLPLVKYKVKSSIFNFSMLTMETSKCSLKFFLPLECYGSTFQKSERTILKVNFYKHFKWTN